MLCGKTNSVSMKNTIESVDSQILRGSQLFQKKGMCSEARGKKWIEQIIHQYTLDQIQVELLIR